MKVLILKSESGEWEGLFIDGKLIDEGHHLGDRDICYMLKQSEKFGFSSDDITEAWLNEEDENNLNDCGSFPSNLSELTGTYE